MKIHNDLKELLDELEMLILINEDDFDRGQGKYILWDFIKSKSLALGKPEPLAKNKQAESVCEHLNTEPLPSTHFSTWRYCLDCETPFKRTNTKDASSR